MSKASSDGSTSALAAGARVGGLVLALGYLTGWVDGPVVAAVGGLALITFGRALLMERQDQALAAAGLAVMAGAVGITALRWGTLELSELRSVQAVLGPTLLIGPEPAATAGFLAAGAALVALTVWVAALEVRGLFAWAWTGLEILAAALALVNAFWGPKVLESAISRSESLESLAVWAVASGAVIVAGVGGGALVGWAGVPLRASLTVAAALALLVAAGITLGAL